MAVATSDSMEVTSNRDVTNEQLAADLAVTDAAPAAEPVAEPVKPTAAATPAAEPTIPETDDDIDPASDAGKRLSKRKQAMQDKIDKATWRFREEERKREALEREIATLKTPKADAAAPASDDRPKLKSFVDRIGTDYDDYESAVEAHAEALTDFKLAARDQASNAAQQTHARQETLHAVATRGQEAHADFDAVLGQFVQQGGRFAPSTAAEAQGPLGDLEQVILQHPIGHSIGYELAKDPALYQRLMASSSRVMFMAEMGKLITRLDGAPSGSPTKPAPVSKTKAPIQPLGHSPIAAESDDDYENMPLSQYVKVMNKKVGRG